MLEGGVKKRRASRWRVSGTAEAGESERQAAGAEQPGRVAQPRRKLALLFVEFFLFSENEIAL